jgi:hypothetical protein
MHKDRRVARIYESGKCKIYYTTFMPYNLYLEESEETDVLVNNLGNFYYWCASRILTLDRKYAKEILNAIGAIQAYTDRDRAAIAISYRALSLMDVYWVRAKGDKKKFSEISLYNHSLSTAFVDVSLRGRNLTLENAELITSQDQAGDMGTPGVAPKAWIRENDEVTIKFFQGNAFQVEAENFVNLEVIDCEPGVKGNTATNVTKAATVETGAVVQVPIFIEQGEKIQIDTRTGEYLGRAKND